MGCQDSTLKQAHLAALELWPHVCSEDTGKYETFTFRHITPEGIMHSASFVAELQKGASKFSISKGGLSLIRKASSGAALMTASVEGVLIVFMHRSVDEVDLSKAPSIQSIRTPGGSAQPWRIYSIGNFTADQQNVIKAFQFAVNGGWESPRDITAKFPSDRKLDVWAKGEKVRVHVAACDTDWQNFNERQCDFLHSGMSESARVVPEDGRSLARSKWQSVFFDLTVATAAATESSESKPRTGHQEPLQAPIEFTINPDVTQLVGGESGSGKTSIMLVGQCNYVDLVVYVIADEHLRGWNCDFVERLKAPGFASEDCNRERSKLIVLLAEFVKYVVGQELHEALCAYKSGDAFRVRLVFDEVGPLGEVVRALCSQGSASFQKVLQWGSAVRVCLVAGGTGVGAAGAHCGSQLEKYVLTLLRPSSSEVLWNEMKRKVTEKAATLRNSSFSTALANVLRRVDADAVCQSACGNPRLAALMIVRCWNMATVTASCHIVQQVNDVDIRFRILVPVAAQFKSLNGLSQVGGSERFRDMLVSALCYAIFPGYKDPNPRHHINMMVQRYGVLVDNTYYRVEEEFNATTESKLLDGGKVVKNPNTHEVACFPTAKGRYSISPAMVAVLYLLLVGNSEQYIRCEGDKFEVALAHMLYIAVLVFQGRPVVELLRFVFGEDAVPSTTVKREGETPEVCETAIMTLLKDRKVTYTIAKLRYNRTSLNMETVVRNMETTVNADKSLKYPALTAPSNSNSKPTADAGGAPAVKSEERSSKEEQSRRVAKAEEHFSNLWKSDNGVAWIEVSPGGLQSADLVVHIPGVLTLPIQCKDRSEALGRASTVEEILKMKRQPSLSALADLKPGNPTNSAIHTELAEKLEKLGNVVPVLCYSRDVLAHQRSDKESVVCTLDNVIFADGLGETKRNDAHDLREHELRLIRRSMLPFTLRELQIDGKVAMIDSCPMREIPALEEDEPLPPPAKAAD